MQLFVENIIDTYERDHHVVLTDRVKDVMWTLHRYVDSYDLVEAAEKIVEAEDEQAEEATALAAYQDAHEPALAGVAGL